MKTVSIVVFLMAILIAMVSFLSGCGGPTEMDGQEQAMFSVWNLTYQRQDPPPVITWWTTRCPIGTYPQPTAVYQDGKCYAGLSYGWGSDVAWRGKFHWSAFAHELMHDVQSRRGIVDPDHKIKADWDLVLQANLTLQGEGL